jgi:chromosome segregation protein
VAKPPHCEWTRFEQLSGGQQALVAVSLNLAFHSVDATPFCLFDEIDSALDSARTLSLAKHISTRARAGQNIFVSHRPQMIEASTTLVGVYTLRGGSRSVALSFAAGG